MFSGFLSNIIIIVPVAYMVYVFVRYRNRLEYPFPTMFRVNLLLLVGVLIWPIMIFGMILILNAPEAERKFINLLFMIAYFVYPMPVLIGNFKFWKNYKKNDMTNMTAATKISLISPLLLAIPLALSGLFCDFKLVCN